MRKKTILLLFIMVILFSGCGKSSSETLEEDLVGNKWGMVLADNSSGTITFYEDGTAIADFGIVNGNYQWYVDADTKQLHISYTLTSYNETNNMIFDVTSKSEDTGYTLDLVDGEYSERSEKIYITVTLSREKEE